MSPVLGPPGSSLAWRPVPMAPSSFPPFFPAHGDQLGPTFCLCAPRPTCHPALPIASTPQPGTHHLHRVPALLQRSNHRPTHQPLYQPHWLSSTVQIAVGSFSRTPQHYPIFFKAFNVVPRQPFLTCLSTHSCWPVSSSKGTFCWLSPGSFLFHYCLYNSQWCLKPICRITVWEQQDFILTANTGVMLLGRSLRHPVPELPLHMLEHAHASGVVCGANSESCTFTTWKICDFDIYTETAPSETCTVTLKFTF